MTHLAQGVSSAAQAGGHVAETVGKFENMPLALAQQILALMRGKNEEERRGESHRREMDAQDEELATKRIEHSYLGREKEQELKRGDLDYTIAEHNDDRAGEEIWMKKDMMRANKWAAYGSAAGAVLKGAGSFFMPSVNVGGK
jgi:hypothetical protein